MTATLRLPCLSCSSPQADDVKHALGTGALDEVCNRTPSGLPIMCCKVGFAGVMPASQPALSDERR
jgi:hypothetical protein